MSGPVGFIGLGNMGGHMANNLLKKGHQVVVYDVVKDSVEQAVKEGASSASSPADVAVQSTQIVTMLPSSPNVIDCYTGSSGIFSKVQSGSLLIDSSTIDPAVSQQMAEQAKEKGAVFMDAPVSGGVLAARDGNLTFMVGGPESSFPAAEAILKHMAKNVVHCGPVGTGEAAKICNNMILAITMIGTSETMNLGIKLGLDSKMLAKILNMSTGRSWSSELYNPCPGVLEGVPSSNDYKGGFGTALMTKDLGLAQAAATVTKTPTPLGSLAHQIYRLMCNSGYSQKDFSSAFRFLQEQDKA
jgi:3-hydroxyisobutyrate dehydrogenase